MAVEIKKLSEGDIDTVNEHGELDAMMIWQFFLSRLFGMEKIDRELAIKETVSCIVLEAAEALQPFLNATKPWKDRTIPWDEVDEEVIDILHFVLAYFNLREITSDEVVLRYRSKNLHNMKRAEEKINAGKIE